MKIVENTPDRLILETFEGPQFFLAYALLGLGIVLTFLGAMNLSGIALVGVAITVAGFFLARRPDVRHLIFDRSAGQFREEGPTGLNFAIRPRRTVNLSEISDAENTRRGRSVPRTNPDPMSVHPRTPYRGLRLHLNSGETLWLGPIYATKGHPPDLGRVINDWLSAAST